MLSLFLFALTLVSSGDENKVCAELRLYRSVHDSHILFTFGICMTNIKCKHNSMYKLVDYDVPY